METGCKTCIHEEVCSLWRREECQDASCFQLDGCDYYREAAARWIPVTERLPDKGQAVLAFGTRSCTTGQFRGTGSEPWFWWWKGNTIKRVTHWKPLPEPPKEEES